MASAAAAAESLTLPEVTQTVILTRVEGRTPMPEGESLEELARHRCTLCLFLSVGLLGKVRGGDLLAAGWHEDAPVLIVQKASWPGEEKCRAEKIRSQAMIIVSLALGARGWPSLKKSKLYDAGFAHRYRRGSKPRGSD
jgi:precorrin-4/cobalt-precorrin-4 C11-methyltransferase